MDWTERAGSQDGRRSRGLGAAKVLLPGTDGVQAAVFNVTSGLVRAWDDFFSTYTGIEALINGAWDASS